MGAEEYLPAGADDLDTLAEASAGCHGCDLYKRATQTVFGVGDPHARVMLVGEQPGDREDREGLPFVGPAGRLLDEALEEAGLDRGSLYVTNAVKHFKWEQRGKVRLHKQPSVREVSACLPWLTAEINLVDPALVVCLGATAARALLGPSFRVTRQRGEVLDGPFGVPTTATVHPSAILRIRDDADRQAERRRFVDDLRSAAAQVAARPT
ncbi:MAG TPA: UdgX family uracil-DNA binding protein [Acidimicrobiales bacterium]|nr:UdgX family uracil-DNA binding protein [Acidimicrobiales bacterium]